MILGIIRTVANLTAIVVLFFSVPRTISSKLEDTQKPDLNPTASTLILEPEAPKPITLNPIAYYTSIAGS